MFNFFYPLPGYIAGAISFLPIEYETVFKILIGFAFILSGTGMYLWLLRHVDTLSALAAGIAYGLAPYHFLNLYVRGDIGELVALAILPWLFFSLESSTVQTSVTAKLRTAILWSFLILSHNGIALVSTPVLFFYGVYVNKKRVRGVLFPMVVALAISSFFWIPALFEQRYLQAARFIGTMYKDHFPSLHQLLWSPWGFGPDVNVAGGLSPQIGPLATAAVVVAVFFIVFAKSLSVRYVHSGLWF